jgi:hypothetical protein
MNNTQPDSLRPCDICGKPIPEDFKSREICPECFEKEYGTPDVEEDEEDD